MAAGEVITGKHFCLDLVRENFFGGFDYEKVNFDEFVCASRR